MKALEVETLSRREEGTVERKPAAEILSEVEGPLGE